MRKCRVACSGYLAWCAIYCYSTTYYILEPCICSILRYIELIDQLRKVTIRNAYA